MFSVRMVKAKIHEKDRQRTSRACDHCRRKKQKVSTYYFDVIPGGGSGNRSIRYLLLLSFLLPLPFPAS